MEITRPQADRAPFSDRSHPTEVVPDQGRHKQMTSYLLFIKRWQQNSIVTYQSSTSSPLLRLENSTVNSATSESLDRLPLLLMVSVRVNTSGGMSSNKNSWSQTGSGPLKKRVRATLTWNGKNFKLMNHVYLNRTKMWNLIECHDTIRIRDEPQW